jgi:hypothetical protein
LVAALEMWRDALTTTPRTIRETDRLFSRQSLHQLIHDNFDAEDLRQLCFEIGIAYDDLGGRGHNDRVRELILLVVNNDSAGRLLEKLRELRPLTEWPISVD